MLRPLTMAVVVILLGAHASALLGQVRIVADQPDYATLAAAAAPRLTQVAIAWRDEARRLSPIFERDAHVYRTEEVEALLNSAETQLLAALEPQELAPLRDSIRLRFRRIRQQLGIAAPGQGSGVAFASLRLEPVRRPPELLGRLVDRLLEVADAVVQRVSQLAGESRFSLRLCVVSHPDAGATFRMRPPEYREGVKSGKTALDIREAALGRYFYKVEPRKKKLQPIECGWEAGGEDDQCLDLWDSSGDQLFECDFAEGSCELRNLPPGGCPNR